MLAGLDAPTTGELCCCPSAARRLPRARAARLPRADAAREPPPLRPALPRARAGASGSGCCSSASGSGRCATSACRRSRAGCGSGSGSAACCCTSRRCVVLDEPFNALDAAGRELLDATLDELAARSTRDRRDARSRTRRAPRDRSGSRSHERTARPTSSRSRAQGPPARAAGEGDACRRCSSSSSRRSTIFHFALPSGAGATIVGARPALDGDHLHRAARADARVRARARAGRLRRARARAVRPQRDLAREGALGARVPRRSPSSSRCRRSPASSPASAGTTVAGGRARGHRDLRRRHAHRRDGGRRPRPRAAAAAALPAARDPDRRRRRRGEHRARRQVPRVPGALRRRLRAALAGPASSTSSPRPETPADPTGVYDFRQ